MQYPTLPYRGQRREEMERFLGLNRGSRIGTGEFSAMENLSSDCFPVLSSRPRRGLYAAPASPQGLIGKERLCYVDGADFVIGSDHISMGLSVAPGDCPKTLVSMGAYVLILPDKKYINTASSQDRGEVENAVTVSGVSVTLCREDGENYTGAAAQKDAPQNPENGDLWLDTGVTPNALRQYSAAQGEWVGISSTYLKLSAPGIGAGFRRLDGVTVSGFSQESLNGSRIIWAAGEDYLVMEGILSQALTETSPVTVERRMPLLDHVVQGENRLWGCRYGLDAAGNRVNEIYACALGDFKNWNRFLGLASDSFAASCGSDGAFTGAAVLGGSALFFKENCVHRVYGSSPASFQIITQPLSGVKSGCENSLAVVGDRLLYRGVTGFCAYDGAGAVDISRNLGREQPLDCAAGAVGDKYYVCGRLGEEWEVLVYDDGLNLWHREDDAQFTRFAALGDRLFALDGKNQNIIGITGDGEQTETVQWQAVTGPLGLTSQRERVSRILLRARLAEGARLEALARYDSQGDWEKLGSVFTAELRSFRLPLRPRRCDHLELMLRGEGDVRIFSLERVMERGSDQ